MRSYREWGRRAAIIPTATPAVMPTIHATVPSTSVLPMASRIAGQTGRLPLIEVPQWPVTNCEPTEVLLGHAADQAVHLAVLLQLLGRRPRVDALVAGDRVGDRTRVRNARNVTTNLGMAQRSRRVT